MSLASGLQRLCTLQKEAQELEEDLRVSCFVSSHFYKLDSLLDQENKPRKMHKIRLEAIASRWKAIPEEA